MISGMNAATVKSHQKVFTIEPDCMVNQAAVMMRDHNVGSLVVADKDGQYHFDNS